MPEQIAEDMPARMPEDMPDKMPESMSDRMPEDLPVTKCINVMVGITRSKVIFIIRGGLVIGGRDDRGNMLWEISRDDPWYFVPLPTVI